MRFLDFELKSVLILYWPFLASQSSLSRTKKLLRMDHLSQFETHTNALNLALFRFLYLQKRIYCKLFIYYTQPLLVDTLLLFNNITISSPIIFITHFFLAQELRARQLCYSTDVCRRISLNINE